MMEIHSQLLVGKQMEQIIIQMVLFFSNTYDFLYFPIFILPSVERYDMNGLVETLPDLNVKRHGCACTKFIVSLKLKTLVIQLLSKSTFRTQMEKRFIWQLVAGEVLHLRDCHPQNLWWRMDQPGLSLQSLYLLFNGISQV